MTKSVQTRRLALIIGGAIIVTALTSVAAALLALRSDKGIFPVLVFMPVGLLPLACALDKRLSLTNHECGRWIVTACIAVLWSLTFEHSFGSGEYVLFWRGYPYRWLTAGISQFTYQPGMPLSWGVYLPGLILDFVFWWDAASFIFVPLRILRAVREAHPR